MKKILMLLMIYAALTCKAQQKLVDSLRSEIHKHPQKDTVWLSLSNKLSFAYRGVDPSKGLALADTNIALAGKLGSRPLLAEAFLDKGGNFIITGLYDSAVYMYNRALPIFQSVKDESGLGTVEIDLGVIYFYKSDYLKSIYYEKEAEIHFKNVHNDLKLAMAYTDLGLTYEGISDFDNSLQYHQKAMRIYEVNNLPLYLAGAYGNLSEVYRGLNNYPESLIYGQKALAISKKAGDNLIISDSYALIGQSYYFMNEPQKAIDNYLKGLEIAGKYNFKNVQSVILQITGSAYNALKDYKKAFVYLEKSIDLFSLLGDKINLAASYDELSKVIMKCPVSLLKEKNISSSGRYASVLNYQTKSLLISQEIGALEKEGTVWADMSNTYKAQGNYPKAYDALKQSIVFKDSVLNDDKKQQVTRLEMQYKFDKKEDSIKAVNDNRQLLAAAEIRQQQIIRNTLITGTIVLLGSGIFVFTAYKRRRDAKAKQHDAEMQRQITDTEMKALRAQMNPHFIFNSLNSINDYIYRNEARAATEFTTKFASLMRRILENSERKKVTLETELETLELYLQLEALRLQNKFSYEIKVDENIDKKNTLFPFLLLQPFLENCILHGLAKKDTEGKIILCIHKEDTMLRCSIEDNGSGFQPTVSVKDMLPGERKSLGLNITKARIDIINKLKQSNGKVEINNLAQGTLAEITIPFETEF